MNTNEKIAKWLGINYPLKDHVWVDGADYILDFLHDRNQQRWMIDEIIKRGYGIEIVYLLTSKEWNIAIYDCHMEDVVGIYKKDLDSALFEAVEQLIDKTK